MDSSGRTFSTLSSTFAVILSAAAFTVALLGPCSSTPGEGGVSICGIGASGNTVQLGPSVLARCARKLADLKTAPQVTDQKLAAVFNAIEERALKGESDAAAFVIELAALQRTQDATPGSARK